MPPCMPAAALVPGWRVRWGLGAGLLDTGTDPPALNKPKTHLRNYCKTTPDKAVRIELTPMVHHTLYIAVWRVGWRPTEVLSDLRVLMEDLGQCIFNRREYLRALSRQVPHSL